MRGPDDDERRRFEALYAEHARDSTRLAYVLTGDVHAAEDLVHDAFARLFGRVTKLRRPDRIRGYLYRSVINGARGRGRTKAREARYIEREAAPIAVPDPAMQIANRDALWRALSVLPIRQKSVLFLRFYLDLSEAATADAMDVSVSAVKSLTSRAMTKLRMELKEHPDG